MAFNVESVDDSDTKNTLIQMSRKTKCECASEERRLIQTVFLIRKKSQLLELVLYLFGHKLDCKVPQDMMGSWGCLM